MRKLQITFKSGAQIVADVSNWKFESGKRLVWNTPNKGLFGGQILRLVEVNLDNVDAIVEIF